MACHETLLLRISVRGKCDSQDQNELYDLAADAVRRALRDAGAQVDVVRAAHPLDPRWKWPDDPVPNRAAPDAPAR